MTDEEAILNVQRNARNIRGQIIDIFTRTEALIDNIIRKTTFDKESDYDVYMDILQKGELTMSVKKKLLKMCIAKFENKHKNYDLTILKSQIDNIIEKRNNLAHWITDTSIEGVSLYKDKDKIRLISFDRKGTQLEVYFNQQSVAELEKNIYAVTTTLTVMQNIIDFELLNMK